MREQTAVMEMKLEQQRKRIAALEAQVRRAKANVELWKHRWERDKRA